MDGRRLKPKPSKGGEDMRVIVFIIRVTLLTGAILLLLSKTAA